VPAPENNPRCISLIRAFGKTAIAEGLARRSSSGEKCRTCLKNSTVFARLTWAPSWPHPLCGDSRSAFKQVIKEIEAYPARYVHDEIHTVIGAGATSAARWMLHLLSPALAAERCAYIGSTPTEYRPVLEKDRPWVAPLPEDRRERAERAGSRCGS